MPDPPIVSVVIAARDVARYIGDTISSVLRQTFDRFELVVVIDGGDDATLRVARSFEREDARVSVVHHSAGVGVSAARNAGLQRCRALYVLFLDGDDLLEPGALTSFVRRLDSPERPVAAIGGHVKIDEAGRVLPGESGSERVACPSGDLLPSLLERNVIVNGGAVCLVAEVARRVGGYDVDLRFGEDWEFWCRVAGAGRFASLGDEVVLRYRQRGASAMTRQRGTPLEPNAAAIDKIFALPHVRARFTVRERARARRRALIDVHWATARAALHRGEERRFLLYAASGVLRYPDSLLRGYLVRYLGRRIAAALARRHRPFGSSAG
jgi:glycosyltransferase involved in cell wall biosynthesis